MVCVCVFMLMCMEALMFVQVYVFVHMRARQLSLGYYSSDAAGFDTGFLIGIEIAKHGRSGEE